MPRTVRTAPDRIRGSGAGPQRRSWYSDPGWAAAIRTPHPGTAWRAIDLRRDAKRDRRIVGIRRSRCSIGAPCAPPVSGPCGRSGPGSAGELRPGCRRERGGRASRRRCRGPWQDHRASRSAATWSPAPRRCARRTAHATGRGLGRGQAEWGFRRSLGRVPRGGLRRSPGRRVRRSLRRRVGRRLGVVRVGRRLGSRGRVGDRDGLRLGAADVGRHLSRRVASEPRSAGWSAPQSAGWSERPSAGWSAPRSAGWSEPRWAAGWSCRSRTRCG